MHSLSYITRKDPTSGEMALPDGKRRIFISYKHSDEASLPLCEALSASVLESLDVAIWYDHNLTAGQAYDEEIKSAISHSDALLLLLTPNILSSAYVLEQEIPYAIAQQVAIIPIIAGISEDELPQIEAIVGRVHMPTWFFGAQSQLPPFSKDAREQLLGGLKLAIANKDLIEQAKLFYEKGYQQVSMRNLTPEQIFVKAYGNLFGVDATADKSLGIKLMESILGMYGDDRDFADLQEQVAYELLSHFYRTDQPDLFFPYLKSALQKGYDKVLSLLFEVYRNQWHPEILCQETDLSLPLFHRLYKGNFGQEADIDGLLLTAKPAELQAFPEAASDLPQIGALQFDGHTAYFQKSAVEDHAVSLIVDGHRIAQYDVCASFGDVSFLYLAYDEGRRALLSLYADFDHYGPETITRASAYHFDGETVLTATLMSEWLKGIRQLPYSPYTFKIN